MQIFHLWQVDLCGHATIAAAHTLFTSGKVDSNIIEFVTLSGILTAKRVRIENIKEASNGEAHNGFFIELTFPSDPSTEFNSAEDSTLISKALGGASVIKIRKTTRKNLIVIVPNPFPCRKNCV